MVVLCRPIPLALCLALLLLGAAPHQDASEKDQEMLRIKTLLEEGAWKGAVKALKGFLRNHVETPEEKAKVARMLRGAEGSMKLEEIQEEYRKKQKIRKALKQTNKFLDDYPDFPDLVSTAEQFLEVVRSQYLLVLEDFEDWGKDEEEAKKKSRLMGHVKVEEEPKFVKQGKRAGRWQSRRGGSSFSVPVPEKDWSDYDFVTMWIYSAKPQGKYMSHLRVDCSCIGGGAFTTLIAIDWLGWKKVKLSMDRKRGVFSAQGRPDWKEMGYFYISHADSLPTSFDIVLDDICLEKKVK